MRKTKVSEDSVHARLVAIARHWICLQPLSVHILGHKHVIAHVLRILKIRVAPIFLDVDLMAHGHNLSKFACLMHRLILRGRVTQHPGLCQIAL